MSGSDDEQSTKVPSVASGDWEVEEDVADSATATVAASSPRRAGRYEFTNVIANRVRQLAANAPSEFYGPNRSLCEVAMLEFEAGCLSMHSIRRLPGSRQERVPVQQLVVPWLQRKA